MNPLALQITLWDSMVLLLLAATIVSALMAVELSNIMYAILFLLGFSVLLGIVFYILNAPIAAFVQIAIYAGAMTVFFVITMMLTRGGTWE